MSELGQLPNVGPVLEKHLLAIGVTTPQQLRKLGVAEVFLRIRLQRDPGACLHLLYGLAGAVAGVAKKELSQEQRAALKKYYYSIGGR